MNLKVIMEENITTEPEVKHIMIINTLDKQDPQFLLHFRGDTCKDKEFIKSKLNEIVDLYISAL